MAAAGSDGASPPAPGEPPVTAGVGAKQPRRGPAPFASFDHDVSDESSPESKQTFQLPEIREDTSCASPAKKQDAVTDDGPGLAVIEPRARSHSTPAVQLGATPRIDISRASSSSHHDSRESSPETALAGTAALGFREDGAADLRSSTEELAFLEGAPGEPIKPAPPPVRRSSRKDSQGSEAALLAISGRTSRLSSIGSQCSAHSAISALSPRLSVVSGTSRSPSPHKMLLETSFCGPRPIETDPEIATAAVEERLMEIADLKVGAPPDTSDRREVRTEVTVETSSGRQRSAAVESQTNVSITDADKQRKEDRNKSRAEERKARPRERPKRQPSELEVYKSANRDKNVIRIKLKPDENDDDESDATQVAETPRKPATLDLSERPGPAPVSQRLPSLSPAGSPASRNRKRSPSPAGGVTVSRKSSFCSLFKSRETIASPDSPSTILRRKKSVTDERLRSKSRDRSTTPTSAAKIRGSVLSLFKTPRKSGVASPSLSPRDGSPVVSAPRQMTYPHVDRSKNDDLKYYEEAVVIHIPLRTPPEERHSSAGNETRTITASTHKEPERPASAPQPLTSRPQKRTELPDGSIIIPLRSPSDTNHEPMFPETVPDEQVTKVEVITEASPMPQTTDSVTSITPASEGSDERRQSSGDNATCPTSEERLSIEPDQMVPTSISSDRPKRKERLIFTTNVGSTEQVFCTQFSITKTPSIASEISSSFPSFQEGEEIRIPSETTSIRTLRDTHITTTEDEDLLDAKTPDAASRAISPGSGARSSSESEGGPEATRVGTEPEARGLVVQESFEELPYVPTTLPQERSLAIPMIPVRERAGVALSATSSVERPRGHVPAGPPRAPLPPPTPAASEKIRIRLPHRPRVSTATATATVSTPATTSRLQRQRTQSGSDGSDSRSKQDWIDFEEVPERRKQPKRIETIPAECEREGVIISYVAPDECRCECHARGEDETPLLRDDSRQELTLSTPSLEGELGEAARVELSVHVHTVSPHDHQTTSSSRQ